MAINLDINQKQEEVRLPTSISSIIKETHKKADDVVDFSLFVSQETNPLKWILIAWKSIIFNILGSNNLDPEIYARLVDTKIKYQEWQNAKADDYDLSDKIAI
ncbi:MAG: hypothetical protein ACD_49C00041G0004 [uncultured bacterium (gcode 4)]|uniref:Uncharacterized protein n=1 Tax=uncultured bacterium (gcode 4) TaxID=1234023 RepID=K2AXG3_9BACT|nr:MAG: hypothetical protein ACD_49C00041G0004 [uncultured bacterium (gcode 4)]